MRLSAFDPGSELMGWASGADDGRLPQAGAWRLTQTGANLGAMLVQLDDLLDAHYDTFQPDRIVYEKPILVFNARYTDAQGRERRRNDSLANVRKTYNLGGHLEFWCARRGIPCHEVDLHDVKRELAGIPGAEKTDMVVAARKLGLTLPATKAAGQEDAADAFGAWLLLLRSVNRAVSGRFDAALWGKRSGILI